MADGWIHENESCEREVSASTCKRLQVLAFRAWSELAGMKLDEGLSLIAAMERESELLPPAALPDSIRVECELLRAAALALKDDAEAAFVSMNAVLGQFASAADHPAIPLMLRLVHWKARRLDAFCEFSRPPSGEPARRRDVLRNVLHLSMESAVELEQLRLTTAQRLAAEALELSTNCHGADCSGARLAVTVNARILYEQGHVDAADRLIRDRLILSSSQAGVEGALIAYVAGARIAAARRQIPFAVLLLREAELLGEERGWVRLIVASLGERVRLLVADGQLDEARACARRLAELADRSAAAASDLFFRCQSTLARARLELANGPTALTAIKLRKLVAEDWSRYDPFSSIEAAMLLSCVLREQGEDDEAASVALRAIGLGATGGLYRVFLDGGKATRDLLAWLYERRVNGTSALAGLKPYVRNLLDGFPEQTADKAGARTKHRSGESLSPRERHIVSLMSNGLSNKRIARELGIAPETVKSHAKHILLKLAAQTRTEAVSRAMSLGII